MNRIVLILMSLSLSVFSQKKQPSKEEKEMIYGITYNTGAAIFKVPDFPFKKVTRKVDEIQKKTIQSTEVINSSVDTLISRGVLKLEKSEYGYNLLYNSRFPSYYKGNDETDIVRFQPVKSNLFNLKKELIEIKNIGSSSFGSESSFKYLNGETTNVSFTTLHKQDQINNAVDFKNNNELSEIKGSVTYNIKFITDYSQVKLSSKNIGTTFKLNNIEYNLVDIINNVILIEAVDPKNRDNEIRLINYDESGNVLVNYSDSEVEQLKKKNKKINGERAGFSDIKGNISKFIFDAFKANPAITLEEYRKTFTIEDILNEKKKYIFINTIAPIKNDFVLYEPVYGIDRTFEMIPNQEKPAPKKLLAEDYNAPQLSANWNEKLFGNIKEYTETYYNTSKKNGKYVKGKMQYYITYKKNSNGEFVEDKFFPKKSDYPVNKYNSLKQKIESITYDDDEKVTGRTIYIYGSGNKLLEEKSYSDSDTLRNVVKYQYIKNSIIKTSFSYDYLNGEAEATESQDDLVYDERGNLIEEHFKLNKSDSGYSDELIIFSKYNSDNRKIESSSQDFQALGDGKIKLDTKMQYLKNDDKKNWTEMLVEGKLDSKKPSADFVERVFVYE
ncbi:hypothetical protein L1276_002127 [Flavobacterium sp. HSC-32F16]|uniref:hypothetical protein n=1 Tax=Flavobacterium sp. HSC-32F16 TaxID=2910964 RepID=UPI0020A32071|nr:hypothetical protein [Flavobacterium sp. HSC-32F16]MCP2026983.1 hypothetical protein [Flavobacterium sp. HSC-32F16]